MQDWTLQRIDDACGLPRRAYRTERSARHREPFARHPELRDPAHPLLARDLASALPVGSGTTLGALLPREARHRWHLSANSSQPLALGLLGTAALQDASLAALRSALDLPVARGTTRWCFERTLEPGILGERPHQTSVDLLIEDDGLVVCLEAKWTEEGLGRCSCTDGCSEKVRARPAYWAAARECFGLLDGPVESGPCRLSVAYQAVRNVAAARALAGQDRTAVFALVYDERNSCFGVAGDWRGWPAELERALRDADVLFRAMSWSATWPRAQGSRSRRATSQGDVAAAIVDGACQAVLAREGEALWLLAVVGLDDFERYLEDDLVEEAESSSPMSWCSSGRRPRASRPRSTLDPTDDLRARVDGFLQAAAAGERRRVVADLEFRAVPRGEDPCHRSALVPPTAHRPTGRVGSPA